MNLVVVIGDGSWAKCYGPFVYYDDVIVWLRANQFVVEDAQIYPVNPPASAASEQE